jgi:hypothetical protein
VALARIASVAQQQEVMNITPIRLIAYIPDVGLLNFVDQGNKRFIAILRWFEAQKSHPPFSFDTQVRQFLCAQCCK